MDSIKIALLGCGTVGTAVAKLLAEQQDVLAARAGAPLELIGIAVNNLDSERDPAIDRTLLTDDPHSIISQADLVIELIGGIEPPRSLIHEAISAGASVITGNKALLAAHGPEIYEAAAEKNVDVYYEAAVAGAVPVVYGLRESLAGDRVLAVQGILNGTTNFILDEMTTKGLDYAEVLARAQELGFAEADPTADVDGFDAAAKAAILASLAFHTRVSLDDVHVHGIRDITAADIAVAKDAGYVIKLIATARLVDDDGAYGIEVRVNPSMVPQAHPLASVGGSFNAIVIEAAAADRLMLYGRGAGGAPTASAVLSDVVAAASKRVQGGRAPLEVLFGDVPLLAPDESVSRYFMTIAVRDEVGTLAEISQLLAQCGVSILELRQSSVDQSADEDDGGLAYLTITTHRAKQSDVRRTVEALGELDSVDHIVRLFRVEED